MKSMANKYQSEWFSIHMWDFHGTVAMVEIFYLVNDMSDEICMVEIEQIHMNLCPESFLILQSCINIHLFILK